MIFAKLGYAVVSPSERRKAIFAKILAIACPGGATSKLPRRVGAAGWRTAIRIELAEQSIELCQGLSVSDKCRWRMDKWEFGPSKNAGVRRGGTPTGVTATHAAKKRQSRSGRQQMA